MTDFEFAVLGEARNYRRSLIRDFGDYLRGHVLEVGAGIGQVTAELREISGIIKLASIEPDPRFCDRMRTTFPGHAIICGTIADLDDDGRWNTIISINVLEHIAEDERELASYSRILAPQHGVLCLFVPARPEIYAPIDKDFGHYRRYTRLQLQRKLEDAGFKILHLHYHNFIGYFGWWLNFCLIKRRRFDLSSVWFFDRVIFPVMHTYENRVHRPPIGQSLIAVARAS